MASLSNAPEFPTVEEWKIINDLIKVFKPADDMTTIISSQSYPTFSIVIPLDRGLQYSLRKISTDTEVGSALKLNMLKAINRRFGEFETSKIVARTTFLDPRFKKLGFGNVENANTAEKCVLEELKQMFASHQINRKSDIQIQTEAQSTQSTENISPHIWDLFDRKLLEAKTYSTPTTMGAITIRPYLEM